jgi:hypothetical protein
VELVFPPAVDCPEFWADYSKAMEVCANLGLTLYPKLRLCMCTLALGV